MPSLLTKRNPKPVPTAWYECLAGFASDRPTSGTLCREGTRLSGSDPIVQAHFEFFAPAELPPAEIDQLRRERLFGKPADAIEKDERNTTRQGRRSGVHAPGPAGSPATQP